MWGNVSFDKLQIQLEFFKSSLSKPSAPPIIKTILGNLQFDHLNSLYNKIEQDPVTNAQFSKGEFSGCLDCEHYRDIGKKSSTGRTILSVEE